MNDYVFTLYISLHVGGKHCLVDYCGHSASVKPVLPWSKSRDLSERRAAKGQKGWRVLLVRHFVKPKGCFTSSPLCSTPSWCSLSRGKWPTLLWWRRRWRRTRRRRCGPRDGRRPTWSLSTSCWPTSVGTPCCSSKLIPVSREYSWEERQWGKDGGKNTGKTVWKWLDGD